MNIKYKLLAILMLFIGNRELLAQSDSLKSTSSDTSQLQTQQGAIYNRPFVNIASKGKASIAIGGYVEGNTNYFVTDGVSDGFSMQLRRTTLFVYSTIANRIKFLSELEFEDGTREINFEFAALDFEIDPAFNFRAGIIMPPIGAFNVNHDGPRYDFVDRPLVATRIIPTTLSEVGFGFHGKLFGHNKVFTYDVYAVNGLQDGVIFNSTGRTFLQAGKSPFRFEEDNNGNPSYVARVAINHRKWAEIGVSYYKGPYNTFKIEGVKVDEKRSLTMLALDFYSVVKKKLSIRGEIDWVGLDLPPTTDPFLANRQGGFYTDFVYTVFKKRVLKYENTLFNVCLRLEAIDQNIGDFNVTGSNIYDDTKAIVPGLSIRPSSNTVIRANYRYEWFRDALGNPASKTAGIQVGVSSYF